MNHHILFIFFEKKIFLLIWILGKMDTNYQRDFLEAFKKEDLEVIKFLIEKKKST